MESRNVVPPNRPDRDQIRSAIERGLAHIGRPLTSLSGGNFAKDSIGDGGWDAFYKDFLYSVAYIFGEYTFADGKERYVVYEETDSGRILEYDDADGKFYLLSALADPGETERAVAERRHRCPYTLKIIPPRDHNILSRQDFPQREIIYCREDI